jgi:hypothetical protein
MKIAPLSKRTLACAVSIVVAPGTVSGETYSGAAIAYGVMIVIHKSHADMRLPNIAHLQGWPRILIQL